MDVFQRVASLLTENMGLEHGRVEADSDLVRDLGADSLDSIELVMAIEDEFNIEIKDDEMDGIQTVGQLAAAVERKLAV